VNITFDYDPIPAFQPFHRSGAEERCLFGAMGSGKSYAICAEAIVRALEFPGIRGLIVRKTIPELKNTTETVFFDLLPAKLYQAGVTKRTGGHYDCFIFPNGSEIYFRSVGDWKEFKSWNLGFIVWDELNEFDEETYLGLGTRLRQKDPARQGLPKIPDVARGMWAAANPEGHDWCWEYFVRDQRGEWFRSTSFDNPYLPPAYLDRLMAYPEPWVRRYVLCQFDEFAGSIYPTWTWDKHVIDPFPRNPDGSVDYPAGTVFWMGLDPGTRDPTAGLWVALDYDKHRLVGIAEYQEGGLNIDAHTRSWRLLESAHRMQVRWRTADPKIRMRDPGSNNTLEDQLRRRGFSFNLGPIQEKDRIPPLGQLIEAGRFVLTTDCPMTYESISQYRWKDLTPAQRTHGEDPPEKPLKKNTHLVEAAQYIAARYMKPQPHDPALDDTRWDAEIRRNIKRQVSQRQHARRSVMVGGVPV
jgi:PBSX family phage terminase large subunit